MGILAAVMLSGACSVETSTAPLARSTPTTVEAAPVPTVAIATAIPAPVVPTIGPPTQVPEPTLVPAPTLEVTADGCVIETRSVPDPARPVYDIELDVDLGVGAVTGRQLVAFTPDLAVAEIVLRLWPNGPRPAAAGNRLSVTNVSVDGVPAQVVLDAATTAVIELPKLAPAGERIEIELDFVFEIGGPNRGRMAATSEWARFGSFYPMVAWEPGVGWATDAPTSGFAEAVTSPTADFRVVINGISDFDVMATGTSKDGRVWEAPLVRDFAVSIGTFTVATAIAAGPDPVTVQVGVQQGLADDAQAYLDRIVASLEFFAQRWGAYPWPSLTVALTPELSGGIEFPTHVMQGPGSIGRTTPHEVAHQWFYALVGNNQGRDPWLDEGLATYAEFRFERVDAASRALASPLNELAGQSMAFWESRFSDYYPAVYVTPAVALSALADAETLDCVLRRYVAANAFGIAGPEAFFEAASGVIDDAETRLAPFGLLRASPGG